MHRSFLRIATILGAVAVALGAFGAHGLKKLVEPETVITFDTGVRYMFYHIFALAICGLLYDRFPSAKIIWAGRAFLIGIILFSGSLFLLTLLKATATVGYTGIGAITPLGGLCFIAGWLLLFSSLREK